VKVAKIITALHPTLAHIFDEYDGYLSMDLVSALECGIEHAKVHHGHILPDASELLGGAHPTIWSARATEEFIRRWRSVDDPYAVFDGAAHRDRLQHIAGKLLANDFEAAQRHLTRVL